MFTKSILKNSKESFLNPTSEVPISDEEALKLIKNRLTALTLVEKDLLSIGLLAEQYNINKDSLMRDYFGFSDNDSEETSEMKGQSLYNLGEQEHIMKNLEIIKDELEASMKFIAKSSVHTKEHASACSIVPKALVAIKYKTPMLFINKLTVYLKSKALGCSEDVQIQNKTVLAKSENILNSNDKKENLSQSNPSNFLLTDHEFYKKLFNLQNELYANRKSLNRMVDILTQRQNEMFKCQI